MPLGNLLAAEILSLIKKIKNPEKALQLIDDTIHRYCRHERFWR